MTAPVFPLSAEQIRQHVQESLAEDIGSGDITAESCIPADARLTALMQAREPLRLAGAPLAVEAFKQLDPTCTIEQYYGDGAQVLAGQAVMRIDGQARSLLSAERTALNYIQHLSGIATLTSKYVEKLEGTGSQLLDTRKTIPGWRVLAKYATSCGGAVNHRMGLFDAVMIKDNHIAVVGSVAKAVHAARRVKNSNIQLECDTLEQVKEGIEAGASSLLLDNMNLTDLRAAVEIIAGTIPLEASGGVSLDTIRDIALTGVDYISVGRLTQSAPAVDLGLDYSACL